MATTQLLAIASGPATSADFVLAAGESATIGRKDGNPPSINANSVIAVQIKDDAGAYWDMQLLSGEKVVAVITGVGTYRVRRVSGAVGAFRG